MVLEDKVHLLVATSRWHGCVCTSLCRSTLVFRPLGGGVQGAHGCRQSTGRAVNVILGKRRESSLHSFSLTVSSVSHESSCFLLSSSHVAFVASDPIPSLSLCVSLGY